MTDEQKPEPNRRGRPRTVTTSQEDGLRVSTYLSVSQYDRLERAARERGKGMSEVLRDLVTFRLR